LLRSSLAWGLLLGVENTMWGSDLPLERRKQVMGGNLERLLTT